MPDAPSPRTAVIYARISLDRQDGAGVERQLEDARALAPAKGYKVTAEITDNSVSAWSGVPRPGFEQVLTSGADAVIVWHLDRLVRRPADLQRVLQAGLTIQPVNGSTLDPRDANGVLVAGVLTSVSQFESDHKSDRVRAAQRQAALAGKLIPRIWGYGDDGIPTDEAKQAVPMMFAAFVRTRNIAEAQRIFTQWAPDAPASRGAIRARLTQPAYAGIVTYAGVEHPEATPQWEPLVDEVTWRQAQAVLRTPSRRLTDHDRGVAQLLGSQLYLCGTCGQTMVGGAKGFYRCSSGKHLNRPQNLDAIVQLVLALRLSGYDAREPLLLGEESPADDAAELAREAAAIEARITQATEDMVAGLIPRGAALDAIQRQRDELVRLNEKLATVRTTSGSLWGYDLGATLSALPLAAWRELLAAQAVVTVHPQIGGPRHKGQPATPRVGSIRFEWLQEPQRPSGRAATHPLTEHIRWEPEPGGWVIPEWLTGPLFHWVHEVVEAAPPMTASGYRAILDAVGPYRIE